jgi:hypothetical protein
VLFSGPDSRREDAMTPDHPLYRRWLEAFGEPPIVDDPHMVEQLLREYNLEPMTAD